MTAYLNALGMLCAIGSSHAEIAANLRAGNSGVKPSDRYSPGRTLALGMVDDDAAALPDASVLRPFERSRNNLLTLAALARIRAEVDAAIDLYGAHRIGIVLGTSTSGIAQSEEAFRYRHQHGQFPPQFHYAQQELASPAAMLSAHLHTAGPAYVHSSACASSAKAMAAAARLINMGLCDAVITGGADSLCAMTVAGFSALESVSASRCNPLSANRNGINIGEGAALFLMTRQPATVALLGWGETSDAYHVSAPDPTGDGARRAIEQALARGNTRADEIEYINLHGTATPQNDAMESRVIGELFGADVAVSSTKPLTGHALGATSAIEAGLCWLAMQDDHHAGMLPPHLWDGVADPALPALRIVGNGSTPTDSPGRPPRRVLSNSFAFGGSNAVLLLGRQE